MLSTGDSSTTFADRIIMAELKQKFNAVVTEVKSMPDNQPRENIQSLSSIKNYENRFNAYFKKKLDGDGKLRIVNGSNLELKVIEIRKKEPRIIPEIEFYGEKISNSRVIESKSQEIVQKLKKIYGNNYFVFIESASRPSERAEIRRETIYENRNILIPVFKLLEPKIKEYCLKNNTKFNQKIESYGEICILLGQDSKGQYSGLVVFGMNLKNELVKIPIRFDVDPAKGVMIHEKYQSLNLDVITDFNDPAIYEITPKLK